MHTNEKKAIDLYICQSKSSKKRDKKSLKNNNSGGSTGLADSTELRKTIN